MAVPLYLANRSLTFRDFSKRPKNIKMPSKRTYKKAKELLED
jgi:hypothetical protein